MLSGLWASLGGFGARGGFEGEVVMFGGSLEPSSSRTFDIIFFRFAVRFLSCCSCSGEITAPSSEMSAVCSAITSSTCCISSPAVL